ncbi:MAG: ABC transporter substrate-binding protein [Syntrophobacterales bacterium]|nr:ABC transporter substrate-binding protein [Syntrophobacterales bacterium]
MRGRAWVIMALFTTLIVWSVGIKDSFSKGEPYKVGAIFSVTGVASFLGEPEKKTAEMIRDAINAKGGINGNKLELIIYDDESDSTKAILAAKRLISKDEVSVIIGPTRSGESLAVAPIAEKEQVPLISCASSYKIVTPPEEKRWIFKVAPSDSHVVEKIYEFMREKGVKKVAILTDSTSYGASGREELLRYAPHYGIEIVADERYGPKDTDLTAQFTKIKGVKPDAIINWSIGPTQILATKTWRQLGMAGTLFFQSHGFGNKKNLEMLGEDAEGLYVPLPPVVIGPVLPEDHPQKKVIMTYTKEYESKFNEPVSSFGGHAWDALYLAIDALSHVGPNRAKIRDYLEKKQNFIGQLGIFNFSPTDHNGLSKKDLIMVQVVKGNWTIAK